MHFHGLPPFGSDVFLVTSVTGDENDSWQRDSGHLGQRETLDSELICSLSVLVIVSRFRLEFRNVWSFPTNRVGERDMATPLPPQPT
jgi:hypothetical protein